MAYVLKNEYELKNEMYIEILRFAESLTEQVKEMTEENYYLIANDILTEAERIEHIYEVIATIPKAGEY